MAIRWRGGLLLLAAVTLAGCVGVPVHVASPSDPPLTGRRLTPGDVAFITPGMTSRDEVIAHLGPPTVELSDLRILVYVWIDLKADWLLVSPLSLPPVVFGTTPVTADQAFLVAMDETDRVVQSGFDERPLGFNTVISQARKWADAQQVRLPLVRTSFAPVPIPEGQAVLYIYRVKPPFCLWRCRPAFSWQFPVAVAIDHQYVTELRDETYAAVRVSAGRHDIVVDPLPPYRAVMRGLRAIDPSRRAPGFLTVDVSSGQQYFLEALSASAGDTLKATITTSVMLRGEADATPVLRTYRLVW